NGLKYAQRLIQIELHERLPTDTLFTISVKNDGYLIPTNMREKIFETFVRLKATKDQQGSGLGLTLARSLALLHNGELQLAPPQDGFNVFVLRLPFEQHQNTSVHGTSTIKN